MKESAQNIEAGTKENIRGQSEGTWHLFYCNASMGSTKNKFGDKMASILFFCHLIFFSIFLSGCAILETHSYFAPVSTGVSTGKSANNYSSEMTLMSFSKNGSAVFETDSFYVEVNIENSENGLLSFGPLYFAIIPCPVKEKFKKDDKFVVAIYCKNRKEEVLILDPNSVQLKIAGIVYKPIRCTQNHEEFDLKNNGLIKIGRQTHEWEFDSVNLTFNCSPKDINRIQLLLSGFIISDKLGDLPEVEFTKTTGYIYSFGP